MEKYIAQIKQILAKTKWTQTELAAELGVSFPTVNRWLNARTKPHSTQLRQIERLYKNIFGIAPLSKEALAETLEKVKKKRIKFRYIGKFLRDDPIRNDFLLELTYHSDAIEGSTLTKKETEAVIFDKATIKDKDLIEHLEASNHAAILKNIFDGKITGPVTEELIRELHKLLMQGIREDAGEYSMHPRAIRGVDLVLPHPWDIPEEMQSLCRKINTFRHEPIEHVARMHADFEAIHPFGDGNGRVGRLIMIIQLIEKNLAPSVISVGSKAQYYEYLEYAQKKSVSHFVKFLAESVLEGYKIIEKYAK